ncbi:hypothetical protein [Mesorhizobium carmichaelinearum]|uniref:hypothetical protein n=1 Tax=Mesorhizobium carmichaelinearum TaxID=1208188 RepID=UPI000BA471B6|nr:hypothetical protein [Mesorhizobium carmichaelinearum]
MAPPKKGLNDPDFWLHVAIDSWEWDYRLGTAFKFKGRDEDHDPLDELRTLSIKGTTVKGAVTAAQAGLAVNIRIHDDPRVRAEQRLGNKRLISVGSLDRVKGGYEGLIFMPDDALPLVLLMLVHGRYGHVNIAALKEARLASRIQSYEFTKSMTNDWG